MTRKLPKPFKNTLVTNQHYVDVFGGSKEEVALAAEIFTESTGLSLSEYCNALEVFKHYQYLRVNTSEECIFVGSYKDDLIQLTKEQLFWPELTITGFPNFNFKLDCGDRPEVRQWLRDNGCCWKDGYDLTELRLGEKYLFVFSYNVVPDIIGVWDRFDLPIIDPIIEITRFTVRETHKSKAILESIKQKEDAVNVMLKEIEELKKVVS